MKENIAIRLVQLYFDYFFRHDGNKPIQIKQHTLFWIFRSTNDEQYKSLQYPEFLGRTYQINSKNCKKVYNNILNTLNMTNTNEKCINVSQMYTIFFNTLGKKDEEQHGYKSDVYIKVMQGN